MKFFNHRNVTNRINPTLFTSFLIFPTAHQNTLESLSYVMLSMAVVGLVHPISAAAFGGIWVVGRVIYGIGYAGSGPEGRYLGGVITHLGDIPLAIMSMRLAYTMIMKSRS